ncbi:hypothetical protein AV926_14150 [Myroides marinus]|uniref:Uncharacterized protein n=1 Tax=Myroides marinus TaxID=703342 RepID=A0A163X919_9FLAO|nr:hypothetical protein [Myroides marinus]KZE77511.1 hypothetical protein AV926_14150 [Myroides marinus]
MKQIRYNETKDLLDQNEVMYIEKEYNSIAIQMPKLGECTYWSKKDKLHIHKQNKWINNGFYFIKNHLNTSHLDTLIVLNNERNNKKTNLSSLMRKLWDFIRRRWA